MLILTKAVLSLMIGFIFSVIFALFLIPILKKKKMDQHLSIYLEERHKEKIGTPTMGGLIFIIPLIILIIFLLIFNKISFSYNLLIVIFVFLGYSLIGFIDDYLIIFKQNNDGLSETSKLFLQTIISVIFFYIFLKANNEPLIWIQFFNIKLDIGWFYGVFILLILLACSNSVNITDGLDGLAGGLSFICFITFGIITYNTGWLDGYESISIFCFALAGCILGFLIFNTYPARIFMGDTGSLCLGATLGSIAILTRHELLLFVVGIVFVIEMLTCIIQRYYYKLTKKRIFPMTPIHHTFEKLGFKEQDIVKIFWITGFIGSLCAIIYGVWL